jgi:citrate lyase subunit beta / citryl-CoA lyase
MARMYAPRVKGPFRRCKEIVSFASMSARPRRSCLTVPASSPKLLEKAATLAVDEVVVDLEDGVAVSDKESARTNLALARARGTLAVRINGVRTPWWEADLAAATGADVVVIPKVESVEDVQQVLELLPGDIGLEIQIETTRGLVEVERIAQLPLEAIVFGPGDFAASLGVPVLTIGAGASEYALARIAVAARAYGVQPVDGPYAVLGDTAGLEASARRALAHGYDGKWVIHPDQVEPVNAVFTPSPEEVERAHRILAAADGASAVGGEMVDAATKKLAEAVLARASVA